MAEDKRGNIIELDLAGLSKTGVALVEKISAAIGGVYKPYQIRRIASAKADADIIAAEAKIRVEALQRRAMHRFLEEEALRQNNIEAITQMALPLLSKNAAPDKVEDDWIVNFFEKARSVSNEEMQALWAKVLSAQADQPGSFSRRTVNLVSDLDRSDAELFSKLCEYCWSIGSDIVPLIFDFNAQIYAENGINYSAIIHLESLGLIKFQDISGFDFQGLPKAFLVHYYGRPMSLEMQSDESNRLRVGKVLLTRAGRELAPICGSGPIGGFFEYVAGQWKAHLTESKS